MAVLFVAIGAGNLGWRSEPPAPSNEPGQVRFARDIRPILADRCFQCHGPDQATRRANLRLDLRESAVADREGGPAITPDRPDSSEVIRRITSTDEEVRMPPADSHKRALSAAEQDLIRRWIAQGAVYEPHWAFVPPVRSSPPSVKAAVRVRNPIDNFILARLGSEGLAPSPEADKATLLRRVFLDLTGLPPTPQEVDAFAADSRPDAYERWVDRIFSTEPHATRTAERLTAAWLDQARYADTCGIHMDAGRQMWLWRDWVISAYRANMPFDRFVTEQLAGDLIPQATDDQKIATGFNRNHVTTDEGGAIAEEYLVEYAVDRTATTGSVFLGLTLGCARCHDHKFDPISNQDFYSLYAFFNSIEEPGLYSQTPDSNRAYEPFLAVPTLEQKATLAGLEADAESVRQKLETRSPEEEQQRAAFLSDLTRDAGIAWASSKTLSASSSEGATLEIEPDGIVHATGENPPKDDYTITLRTDATGLRVIALEALLDPALKDKLGRADNGNAVVTGISAQAVSVTDPEKKQDIKLIWAWADHSQTNGDYDIAGVLYDNDTKGARGWALGGHNKEGGRVALFLTDRPLGFEGGTELRVQIQHRSMYKQHALARVRLSLGTINDGGLARLPHAPSRWYLVGPFPADDRSKVYDAAFGPEEGDRLDFARNFGFGNQYWHFDGNLADNKPVKLADGLNVSYVGRLIYSPTARDVEVSLGSDDAFKLYLNGSETAAKFVERSIAPDQDKAVLRLRAGPNALVLKIANTGGDAAYYYRAADPADLQGDLVAGLLPESARSKELAARLDQSWRIAFLPSYRKAKARLESIDKQVAEITVAIPRTMVMKELEKPRETYILKRGVYDQPDKTRPVSRAIPVAFGKLADDAPANRLGLAHWMTAPDNPLLARVTVNRLWELAFGIGIVRTSEDFGFQGEFPTHPELLDWLAVEFRESQWDVRHMLRLIVTSATYRQSSVARPELADKDPDNRLLAHYPRRRLSAEHLRDQALFVSGLLVEKTGGPSVKPYQPEGLWQEVAMTQSNTREFKRGEGPELYRRSMYTYWKRAAPPPSMVTFDAPTRESCTIRRATTSTPLQALVLWNDVQFVEAARMLAARTLQEPGDDSTRLASIFKRCLSRAPTPREAQSLTAALADFRARYAASPEDAEKLLKPGEAQAPSTLEKPELAAWTMIASSILNLYQTTTQD